jgi:hypothetical protein
MNNRSTSAGNEAAAHLGRTSKRLLGLVGSFGLALIFMIGLVVSMAPRPIEAASSGGLTITILSAPNLVVDSNALTPATYSPKAATIAGKFCNTNASGTLTNVMGYIGDFKNGSGSTPGLYPVRYYSDTGFSTQYPWAHVGDVYSLTHVGGSLGLLDASRYIGNIAAGECKYQYWHFTYPLVNPAQDSAVWGITRLTSDDLALRFDVWATSPNSNVKADTLFTETMRNEISAMANKIEPNPSGTWFNSNASVVLPGELITSNGILYTFGVVNQGFDADMDFVPDFDAWMQPIGDPSFDPSCFRLIRTSGILTVSRSSGNPDYIEYFTDKLYFKDLPQDNTGMIGNVYYTFMALNGPCSTALSPYQEAGSGSENEKFNGDYGAAVPPPSGYTPAVTITKDGTQFVSLGGFITYTVKLNNKGNTDLGLPSLGVPVVISDSIPPGTNLSGGIFSDTALTILYSTDNGVSWSSIAPTPLSSVTNVQYWLSNTLAPSGTVGSTAQVTFTVQVTTTPPTKPYITNCAGEQFGSGASMGQACFTTYLTGTFMGGHYVWADLNYNTAKDTSEAYITNTVYGVSSTLYYDLNGNKQLDAGDPVISTTATLNTTGWYTYSQLYTGTYIVLIDKNSSGIPYGWRATTPITHLLEVSSTSTNYQLANFGFAPSLTITKRLATPVYDHGYAFYNIGVTNLRPGGGDQVGNSCRYTVWAGGQDATNSGTGQKVWLNIQNAFNVPDGTYATAPYKNAGELVGFTGWNLNPQPGNVVTVDLILSLHLLNNTAADDLDVSVVSSTGTISSVHTYDVRTLPNGTFVIPDIATTFPFTWTDFSGLARSVVLKTTKAGNTNVVFHLDAVGFYVYSDQPCVTAATDDIMTTVPLTDTYDFSKLLYVSSVPTATTVNQSTGVITWTNIGPIAPGETKNVQVTFFVSDVNVLTTINNSTCTISTTFSDGGFANDGCAKVTGQITPTGYITGYLWNDVNDNGWQTGRGFDDSDFKMPNVLLYLLVCSDSSGAIISPTKASINDHCDQEDTNRGQWLTATTKTTDQNGYYEFNGLVDGWYVVVVEPTTIPNGFVAYADPNYVVDGGGQLCGTALFGSTGCTNSWGRDYTNQDISATTTSNLYPIVNANTITQVNLGYKGDAVLYGKIWQDYNGDGTHQANEIGLDNNNAGITVTLFRGGVAISTTQTDASGNYSFTKLSPNTYTVTVSTISLPTDGGTWTQTAQGLDYGSPCGPCTNVQTATLTTGQISGSYDFGYHRSGALIIGDTVYYDWNGNGVQDGNEEGIISVTLTLYRDANSTNSLDGSDPIVMTATTSITGFYLFTNLPTRTAVVTYFVSVDTGGTYFPLNVIQTGDPDESGTCQVCNSIGRAPVTNTDILYEDFGYQPYGLGSIGDTVYRDMNGNGVQDGVLETGIQSITVRLYVDMNNNGTYQNIYTATTDSTGYYLFTGLPYTVTYKVMVDSADTDLPKDSFNSTYIPSTPITVTHTLTNSTPYLDADFGFMPMGAVGDTVYWDNNGNGTQDTGAGEGGIGGIVITLTNLNTITPSNGIPILAGNYKVTQTTSLTGFYAFTGLVSGTYSITVGITPTVGLRLTGDPDAYIVPCSGPYTVYTTTYNGCDSMSKVVLPVGAINMSQDFGYLPLGVIGDFVFKDLNKNNQQDPGEPGISGVVITITNNGTTYTTTTDLDGKYSFSNLPVSTTWLVTFTQPAGYTYTVSSSTAISNGVGSVGITATVFISSSGQVSAITTTVGTANCTSTNDCSLHVDSGLQSTGTLSIGGHVFYDTGGNGLTYLPGTDNPYGNVPVYLYDSNNNPVGQTTTDANGTFTFTNLVSGTYSVAYNSNWPAFTELTKTADPDVITANLTSGICPLCNNYSTFQITTTNVMSKDFGLYGSMDFGDLPNSYKTLLGVEGPRAVLSSSLYLGNSPQTDAEGDGQPSPSATGDNTAGTNDENGITRVTLPNWVAGSTVSVTIKVVNTTGYSPTLYGWIDWNRDGLFDSSTEIINFGVVATGTLTKSFTIPAALTYATPFTLGVRFRIYNGAAVNPQPTGLALSAPTGDLFAGSSSIGEVEDYVWNFGPTAITLQTMTATSGSNTLGVLVLIIASLLSAALLFGLSRRRKVA